MSDLSAPGLEHFNRVHGITERLPDAPRLTAEERQEWQKEYCNWWEYIQPTGTVNGHFRVVDVDGDVTTDRNFEDAMDMAVAKWILKNPPIRAGK